MYNVKVFTYPDLSQQVRVYTQPVRTREDGIIYAEKPSVELDPFHFLPVKTVKVFDRDFDEAVQRSIDVSHKRTVNKIYMYSRSNVWDYFVTFTFSKEKVDRYNYEDCSNKISKWLKNMKQRYCPDMKYIVVPEQHKDGAYHFHGLFSNIEGMDMRDSGKRVIAHYYKNGRKCFRKTDTPIYIIGRYHLGWTTATRVRSNERVAGYITKYVTKELVSNVKGKRRYWISRNLDVPILEEFFLEPADKFIYQSEISEMAVYEKHVECKEIEQTLSIYELE